jgi:hypothetical protein
MWQQQEIVDAAPGRELRSDDISTTAALNAEMRTTFSAAEIVAAMPQMKDAHRNRDRTVVLGLAQHALRRSQGARP